MIGFSLGGSKDQKPPSIEQAIRDLDQWLDEDRTAGLTYEEIQLRKVMGVL